MSTLRDLLPTRDSLFLTLTTFSAALGYLAVNPDPRMWSYADWVKAMAFLIGVITAKLSTSPLKGDGK